MSGDFPLGGEDVVESDETLNPLLDESGRLSPPALFRVSWDCRLDARDWVGGGKLAYCSGKAGLGGISASIGDPPVDARIPLARSITLGLLRLPSRGCSALDLGVEVDDEALCFEEADNPVADFHDLRMDLRTPLSRFDSEPCWEVDG